MSEVVQKKDKWIDLTNAETFSNCVSSFSTEEGLLMIYYWGPGPDDYLIVGKMPEGFSSIEQRQLCTEIESMIKSALHRVKNGENKQSISSKSEVGYLLQNLSITQEAMDLLFKDKMNSLKHTRLTRTVECQRIDEGFTKHIIYHEDQIVTSEWFQYPEKYLESYLLTPLELKSCSSIQLIRYFCRNMAAIGEKYPEFIGRMGPVATDFAIQLLRDIEMEKMNSGKKL